jgi:hypothetical protein
MTIDGVWISELIYWPLTHTTRKYNQLQHHRYLHNLQITTAPGKPFPACCVFTSLSLATAPDNGDFSASRAQFRSSRSSSCSPNTDVFAAKVFWDMSSFFIYLFEIYSNTMLVTKYIKRRAVAQAISRWLPTAKARVRVRAACGICGCPPLHCGRISQSTSVSPANHSTNFSIIIITRGRHNRPLVAAVPSELNWTPPPTIPIKKNKNIQRWNIGRL